MFMAYFTPVNRSIARDYKTALTTTPTRVFASLVSLWDLVYYQDSTGVWLPRISLTSNRHIGKKLDHTTICFDEKVYAVMNNERIVNSSFFTGMGGVSIEDWFKYGIDIAIPDFDTRAKPFYLHEDNVVDTLGVADAKAQFTSFTASTTGYGRGIATLSTSEYIPPALTDSLKKKIAFKIFPREACIAPSNTIDLYRHSVYTKFTDPSASMLGIGDWSAYSDNDNKPRVPSVCAEDDADEAIQSVSNYDIILTGRDTSFMIRYGLANEDGSMITDEDINPRSAYTGLVMRASVNSLVWKILATYYKFQNIPDDNVKLVRDFSDEDRIAIASMSANNPDGALRNFLMKNCYVYVKAPFFADYIKYEDFNQSLSPADPVRHRDIVVGKGDHTRYDQVMHNVDEDLGYDEERDTSNKTMPFVSTVTPTIDLVIGDKSKSDIIKEANSARGREIYGSTQGEPLVPRGYIYDIEEGSSPTANSEFNTFISPIDSRTSIPSPYFDPDSRLDEDGYEDTPIVIPAKGNLFVSGRIFSATIDELWVAIKQLASGNGQLTNMGVTPIATFSSSESTRLKMREFEVKSSESQSDPTFVGDPLKIKYEFIPESSERIEESHQSSKLSVTDWVATPKTFKYKTYDELKTFADNIAKVTSDIADDSNHTEFSIAKITDFLLNETIKPEYIPDEFVLSNRELEALVKGLRNNLERLCIFLARNFVKIGPINGIEQLHRDHSKQSKGPEYNANTPYNASYVPIASGDNAIQDYESKAFDADWTTQGLNTVAKVSDRQTVPSWAVYLGADGGWHSTHQGCYVPVTTELY
jgi:hypothetical protein